MENIYIDYNFLVLQINDAIINRYDYPLDYSLLANYFLNLKYGEVPVISTIVEENGLRIAPESIPRIEKIAEEISEELEIFRLLLGESTKEEQEEFQKEEKKLEQVVTILETMKQDTFIATPKEEDYVFITLLKPNGETILESDIDFTDARKCEIALRNLEKMEELVTSQLSLKGKFDYRANGNGMHIHDGHSIYKNVGENVRIQIRRSGKEGDVICVLAIHAGDVHRNEAGENKRTALYQERENLLKEFLKKCPRDEEGTYYIEEAELRKLQEAYQSVKRKLSRGMGKKWESENAAVIEEFIQRLVEEVLSK